MHVMFRELKYYQVFLRVLVAVETRTHGPQLLARKQTQIPHEGGGKAFMHAYALALSEVQ